MFEYQFNIKYKPGIANKAAEFLSRFGFLEDPEEKGNDKAEPALIVFGEQKDLKP